MPDWLALRAGADSRARDTATVDLLGALGERLEHDGVERLQVVDLGAGTGANRRYLQPRLPVPQRWVVLDHDPDLLALDTHADAQRVLGRVGDLDAVLGSLGPPADGEARLLTCSALLDVLTCEDLSSLAAAVVGSGAHALFALSVTGAVAFEPEHADDTLLGRGFDDHQRLGGSPGPDAPRELVRMLEGSGALATSADTPWALTSGTEAERVLLGRWMDERVRDAAATVPQRERDRLDRWHEVRRAQLASGTLSARVEHVDVLVLSSSSVTTSSPRT